LGHLRSAREALKGRPADILPPLRNVEDYDLVVLGTPVWAGHVSSPMRAYIAAHEPARARVAFFCTLGGSRAKRVLDETRALCGKEPVATLAVTDVQIDREGYDRELEQFVRAMALRKAA
jgi:hypothetical protein